MEVGYRRAWRMISRTCEVRALRSALSVTAERYSSCRSRNCLCVREIERETSNVRDII